MISWRPWVETIRKPDLDKCLSTCFSQTQNHHDNGWNNGAVEVIARTMSAM